MKRAWIRLIALTLALMFLMTTFCTGAFAAKNFSNIRGTANKNPVTKSWMLTVKTGKAWFSSPSITFKISEGYGMRSKNERGYNYGSWGIIVYNSKGKQIDQKLNYLGDQITVSGILGGLLGTLQRNSTYRIKIYCSEPFSCIGTGIPRWVNPPAWRVASTNNIDSIKFS